MVAAAACLSALGTVTRAVNRVFAACAGVLALFILFAVLFDVVLRYLLNDPTIWAIDFASFALSYLFFLALAPALESGFHVSVDYFSQQFGAAMRRRTEILAALLAIVFAAILFWELLDATIEEFIEDNLTPTAVPVPAKYVVMIGPFCALQLLLTSVVMAGQVIRGGTSTPSPAAHGQADG